MSAFQREGASEAPLALSKPRSCCAECSTRGTSIGRLAMIRFLASQETKHRFLVRARRRRWENSETLLTTPRITLERM